MSEYPHDISVDSMEMLKYYLQSNDITMTAHGWAAATGFTTPPDCAAVRIQEADNGGEVIYLTGENVLAGEDMEP